MDVLKPAPTPEAADLSTLEVARLLGMAVRSVQLMVDRGELQAWKTPGGHRRISRTSVDAWLNGRGPSGERGGRAAAPAQASAPSAGAPAQAGPAAVQILLIEDSVHFQNLVSMVVRHAMPSAQLHIAPDGITGLTMAGKLQPDILLIDILLPGIDGATLITGLRSHGQFDDTRLIVVTSLTPEELAPYAIALSGVPVVHKSRLAIELPALLLHDGRQAA